MMSKFPAKRSGPVFNNDRINVSVKSFGSMCSLADFPWTRNWANLIQQFCFPSAGAVRALESVLEKYYLQFKIPTRKLNIKVMNAAEPQVTACFPQLKCFRAAWLMECWLHFYIDSEMHMTFKIPSCLTEGNGGFFFVFFLFDRREINSWMCCFQYSGTGQCVALSQKYDL